MKTYYDLTAEEKKEYLKEFKKTPGGKKLNNDKNMINGLWIFLSLFIGVTSLIPAIVDQSFEVFDYVFYILFLAVIVIEFENWYFNLCFSSWLKNKHNIRKW